MKNFKTIEDFKGVPKYWTEYLRLGIAFVFLCIAVFFVYFYEKQWITILASCLTFLWFIVQLDIANGSTLRNVCIQYESYLRTLSKNELSLLIKDEYIPDETKHFIIDFLDYHHINLNKE